MDAASLAELADSIREQGVMQPILVRPVDGARFEIIAGERRWRAAQQAGLREVPALVKTVPDQAALALALIENIQREDLNPLEEAQGLEAPDRRVRPDARGRREGGRALAQRGVEPAAPERRSRSRCRSTCSTGALEMGHARALLALPAAQQAGAAVRVVNAALSVRDTERLVHGARESGRSARRARKARPRYDADTARLENELAGAARGGRAHRAGPQGRRPHRHPLFDARPARRHRCAEASR